MDILDLSGRTASALAVCGGIVEASPQSLLEMIIIHPLDGIRGCEWNTLPSQILKYAEMRFHSGSVKERPIGKQSGQSWQAEDAYRILGMEPERGCVVVVRPDGYVSAMVGLDEAGSLV